MLKLQLKLQLKLKLKLQVRLKLKLTSINVCELSRWEYALWKKSKPLANKTGCYVYDRNITYVRNVT